MFKKDDILFALFIVTTGMLIAFGIYYVLVCLLGTTITLLPWWIIAFMFVGFTLLTLATWGNNERF